MGFFFSFSFSFFYGKRLERKNKKNTKYKKYKNPFFSHGMKRGFYMILFALFCFFVFYFQRFLEERYSCIARAAFLPAPIAEITVAAPVTISPPA